MPAAVKVLRDNLALSTREVFDLLKNKDGTIYRGTHTESSWLVGLLEQSGEAAEMIYHPVIYLLHQRHRAPPASEES